VFSSQPPWSNLRMTKKMQQNSSSPKMGIKIYSIHSFKKIPSRWSLFWKKPSSTFALQKTILFLGKTNTADIMVYHFHLVATSGSTLLVLQCWKWVWQHLNIRIQCWIEGKSCFCYFPSQQYTDLSHSVCEC
jgi:hypothetical protein